MAQRKGEAFKHLKMFQKNVCAHLRKLRRLTSGRKLRRETCSGGSIMTKDHNNKPKEKWSHSVGKSFKVAGTSG